MLAPPASVDQCFTGRGDNAHRDIRIANITDIHFLFLRRV